MICTPSIGPGQSVSTRQPQRGQTRPCPPPARLRSMSRPRQRERVCPRSIFRCAHLDSDVVQAWRSASDSYVVQGPTCGGILAYPTWTFTRKDFEAEWTHRVERMHRYHASEADERSTA